MLVVYFILQINGNSYYVDQKIIIGLIVVRGIYISATCNLIVILAVAIKELRQKIRKKYYNYQRRKASRKQ